MTDINVTAALGSDAEVAIAANPTDPMSTLLPWTDLSVFESVNFFVQGNEFAGLEPLLFADAGLSFSQSNLGNGGMNGGPGGTDKDVPEDRKEEVAHAHDPKPRVRQHGASPTFGFGSGGRVGRGLAFCLREVEPGGRRF